MAFLTHHPESLTSKFMDYIPFSDKSVERLDAEETLPDHIGRHGCHAKTACIRGGLSILKRRKINEQDQAFHFALQIMGQVVTYLIVLTQFFNS